MIRFVQSLIIQTLAAVIVVASCGCGTIRERDATDQLVLSDAVDRSISSIDFRHLSGRKVYFDASYIRSVKGLGFVNADYVTSAIRQQMVAAGCLLQDASQDADIIVEARIGALGADGHRVTYGIPENNSLTSAATLIPSVPVIPTIPEISVGQREMSEAAAKVAAFAYDRETRHVVWQSGVSQSTATARDTWVMGIGPFQSGSIRDRTKLVGSKFRFGRISEGSSPPSPTARPPVDYTAEVRFQDGWPLLDGDASGSDMLQGEGMDGKTKYASDASESESESVDPAAHVADTEAAAELR